MHLHHRSERGIPNVIQGIRPWKEGRVFLSESQDVMPRHERVTLSYIRYLQFRFHITGPYLPPEL